MDGEPKRLDTQCPSCRKRTPHVVLAGRGSGRAFQGTVRCETCGTTHATTLRRSARVVLPVIVSREAASERHTLQFRADDQVRVGDELELPDGRVLVTSVEAPGDRRLDAARAGDLVAVWTKAFDQVSVKVSVTLGARTQARILALDPDDLVEVGDVLEWPDLKAAVFSVKTRDQRLRRGAVRARDVVRVHARAMGSPPPPGPTARSRGPPRGAPRARAPRYGSPSPRSGPRAAGRPGPRTGGGGRRGASPRRPRRQPY